MLTAKHHRNLDRNRNMRHNFLCCISTRDGNLDFIHMVGIASDRRVYKKKIHMIPADIFLRERGIVVQKDTKDNPAPLASLSIFN